MTDLDQVLLGVRPTVLFRQMLASTPEKSKWEIASEFMERFERIDGVAAQIIWGWHRPGGRTGLGDEEVDSSLFRLLREAGYDVLEGSPTSR